MTSKRVLAAAVAAAALLAAVLAGLAVSARGQPAGDTRGAPVGNAAVDWNAIATAAIVSPAPAGAGQPPHVAVLSVAMVQGAVYDAVNAIDGGYQPYLASPAANPGDSKEAAVAAAAFNVLVGLFPSQLAALQATYDAYIASLPPGPATDAGVAVGEAAAAAMLAAREDDGRFDPFTPVEGTAPGEWRKTPPNFGGDPAAWAGNVDPFLVPDIEMLRTRGPYALTSWQYARDFNEVKRIGSLGSTKRTADQTAAAIFWQDNGAAIWNRVFRALATERGLDVVDTARMLAMTTLAGADAVIGCWNDKYYWSFWRPITAIREAASDGNRATHPDVNWVPLFDPSVVVSGPALVTPGFPDHPSGHTCYSGATLHTLTGFFGTDRVDFTAVSNKCSPAPCPNRSFPRFSVALREIIDARVWSGIHFRNADDQGALLGKEVARWLQKHYFKPA
jgi:hypothetical protein